MLRIIIYMLEIVVDLLPLACEDGSLVDLTIKQDG